MSSENPGGELSFSPELSDVVAGGYCVGCGACASVDKSPLVMRWNAYGQLTPRLEASIDPVVIDKISRVCPFSDKALDETEISRTIFQNPPSRTSEVGSFEGIFAGYVQQGEFRSQGSSGGLGSWIIDRLLAVGSVDHAIHVKSRSPDGENPAIFEYKISTTSSEISAGAKSRYYPIEISRMMAMVRGRPGRYVITGVPCFIKAVRLLQNNDPVLKDRIVYTVGLVCGHLKSSHYSDWLAWNAGIAPGHLERIDYRRKYDEGKAIDYGVAVSCRNDKDKEKVIKNSEVFGHKWGYGIFKLKACDFCDDVFAETADVTVGDAWLPQYVDDPNGTNIMIVRNKSILKLVEGSMQTGVLKLDRISSDLAVQSQAGGLRHRRDGLSHRLKIADQNGTWRPKKRVKSGAISVSRKFEKIIEARIIMREQSANSFLESVAKNDRQHFVDTMRPIINKYELLYAKSDTISASVTQFLSRHLPWLARLLKSVLPNRVQSLLRRLAS